MSGLLSGLLTVVRSAVRSVVRSVVRPSHGPMACQLNPEHILQPVQPVQPVQPTHWRKDAWGHLGADFRHKLWDKEERQTTAHYIENIHLRARETERQRQTMTDNAPHSPRLTSQNVGPRVYGPLARHIFCIKPLKRNSRVSLPSRQINT